MGDERGKGARWVGEWGGGKRGWQNERVRCRRVFRNAGRLTVTAVCLLNDDSNSDNGYAAATRYCDISCLVVALLCWQGGSQQNGGEKDGGGIR